MLQNAIGVSSTTDESELQARRRALAPKRRRRHVIKKNRATQSTIFSGRVQFEFQLQVELSRSLTGGRRDLAVYQTFAPRARSLAPPEKRLPSGWRRWHELLFD